MLVVDEDTFMVVEDAVAVEDVMVVEDIMVVLGVSRLCPIEGAIIHLVR